MVNAVDEIIWVKSGWRITYVQCHSVDAVTQEDGKRYARRVVLGCVSGGGGYGDDIFLSLDDA